MGFITQRMLLVNVFCVYSIMSAHIRLKPQLRYYCSWHSPRLNMKCVDNWASGVSQVDSALITWSWERDPPHRSGTSTCCDPTHQGLKITDFIYSPPWAWRTPRGCFYLQKHICTSRNLPSVLQVLDPSGEIHETQSFHWSPAGTLP